MDLTRHANRGSKDHQFFKHEKRFLSFVCFVLSSMVPQCTLAFLTNSCNFCHSLRTVLLTKTRYRRNRRAEETRMLLEPAGILQRRVRMYRIPDAAEERKAWI